MLPRQLLDRPGQLQRYGPDQIGCELGHHLSVALGKVLVHQMHIRPCQAGHVAEPLQPQPQNG